VEELWSLDADSLRQLGEVYGVVFLFKWQKEEDPREVERDPDPDLFFAQQVTPAAPLGVGGGTPRAPGQPPPRRPGVARPPPAHPTRVPPDPHPPPPTPPQVITNACATQALLSVLFNARGVSLGPELTQLRDFTAGFTPDMKGLAIGNSELVRAAHNSFHRPDPFLPDDDDDRRGGEAFHFISYVPVGGALYELDGLREGPIRLCDVGPGDDWLTRIAPIVQGRMSRYSEKEIRFNLMAVVRDSREVVGGRIAALEARAAGGGGGDAPELARELATLRERLAAEEERHRAWARENVRRRHSYVPFLFNALKALARKGLLAAVVDRARGGAGGGG